MPSLRMIFFPRVLAPTIFLPVVRHVFNSPYISGFLERQTQDPKSLKFTERKAVDYTRPDIIFRGQALQIYDSTNADRLGGSSGASLQVHQNYLACFGKRIARIVTGESYTNVGRDASPSALIRFRFVLRGPQSQSLSQNLCRSTSEWRVVRDL